MDAADEKLDDDDKMTLLTSKSDDNLRSMAENAVDHTLVAIDNFQPLDRTSSTDSVWVPAWVEININDYSDNELR